MVPHLALLDQRLCELARGDIKRLMVFMPPRHGKSMLCSQYFPAWAIGRYQKKVILTSYEASFASSWGRKARDVLEVWGPAIFNVTVSDKSAAADWWELAGSDGAMMTAGMGGPITGKGGNILIIDDPVKNAEEARSLTIREKQWEWFASTAYTRMEPEWESHAAYTGAILLIMTRWNADDLAGRLLKRQAEGGDAWHVVEMPALAEHDEYVKLDGGIVYERKQGEALFPQRFPTDRLLSTQRQVGSRVWSALYQQRPAPDDGIVWRRTYFANRYREVPELRTIVQAVDSAFKTGVGSDYSVIATWGATATDFYLLDVWRAQVEFPELKHAIVDQATKRHPTAVLIEDAASGQSAIQELKRSTRLPIIPFPARGSKVSRADAVSPLGEAGKIWLPEHAPWLADWIEEHIAFPNGEHDDQCDTSSMALARLSQRKGTSFILDHLRARTEAQETLPLDR
jgi:predicted phage terminase large subunit-like protein